MNIRKIRSAIMLVIAALVWGAAMAFQSEAAKFIGPMTFQSVRFLIGGTVLLPVVFWLGKKDPGEGRPEHKPKGAIFGGVLCGIVLAAACLLQQYGVTYTTVGKAGFLTSLYIIIVPVLGLFMRKKVGVNIWISVGIALVGMYFLCMNESFTLSVGDTLVLLCAFVFSIQIILLDKYTPIYNALKLSCIQFYVCGFVSMIGMFIFEQPSISQLIDAWVPILYTGACSCGIGYTFQAIAQKDLDPTLASLLMSLESVFSAIFGSLIASQIMTKREIFGCVIMFCAIVLAQFVSPDKKQKNV